ncbi:uncharacterized protein YuzB (UPF0349 family) [Neobacillus niacini]|jgi:uncharacterized protein YuzB (UPF0349 family)|uniref:DUF1450 domain-containing protein n=1 Tax=Neobacillus niacini TaxID=86668 RepID=UPI00277D6278|nr:DUF1450 domain-containing protein [Neobacillus niacini]MDQ1002081.1 uncharacterized protein YuzB (UPF0349 family) [Neobacillus niacini]
MRVAKFCERNIKVTDADKVIDLLRLHYQNDVDVRIVDCFSRCLECRVRPFFRIQLTTIEANDARILINKILQTVKLLP